MIFYRIRIMRNYKEEKNLQVIYYMLGINCRRDGTVDLVVSSNKRRRGNLVYTK
jgi:hypothetical protein